MHHTMTGDTVNRSVVESGYVAKRREIRKEQKYSQQRNFLPFKGVVLLGIC